MRALVIGGSGFTGRHVLEATPDSWDVAALCRRTMAETTVRDLGAEPLRGDLDDPGSVLRAIDKWSPDVVLCLASLGFGHGPGLVDALEGAGVGRVVFTSTTGIFTRLEPRSKAVRVEAEAAIAASQLDWTIVRPTMIYGAPGDRNIERLIRRLLVIPVIPAPRRGRALQQPVHVADLARTIVVAATAPDASRQAYDVAGPEPLTFADLVAETGRAMNRPSRVAPVPFHLIRAVVAAQEAILPNPRLRAEQIDRLVEDKAFPIDAARVDLGHDPRPFAVGVRSEIDAVLEAHR